MIAGGEPLLHRELPKIVEGVIARKKFAIVCTNALLLEKKIDQYKPSPYFTWSIHLDGDQEMHDKSVCQQGVYDRAVKALKPAKAKGFRVTINCTLFNDADPERVAAFFDTVKELGVDGITVSPGYAYERAPDQKHFLNRTTTKELFRAIFRARRHGARKWAFNQSSHVPRLPRRQPDLPLHALGQPDAHRVRLAAALLSARRRLRQDLQGADGGDRLGTPMASAITRNAPTAWSIAASRRAPSRDTVTKPWKAARVALMGVKTEGAMAPDIPLESQRQAEYVFDKNVAQKLSEIRRAEAEEKARKKAAATL